MRVRLALFDRDIIHHVLDTSAAFCQLRGAGFLVVIIHETAQLNSALEGGYIHIRVPIHAIRMERMFDAASDCVIVNILPCAFMIFISGATSEAYDRRGSQHQGREQSLNFNSFHSYLPNRSIPLARFMPWLELAKFLGNIGCFANFGRSRETQTAKTIAFCEKKRNVLAYLIKRALSRVGSPQLGTFKERY